MKYRTVSGLLIALAFILGSIKTPFTAVLAVAIAVVSLYLGWKGFIEDAALKRQFEKLVAAQSSVDFSEFLRAGSPWFGNPAVPSGIAVSAKNRTLILASKDKVASYGFDQVREWETRSKEAGRIVVVRGGFAAAAHAGAHNAGQALRAQLESGLFVHVKDVDRPIWQIHLYKKAKQERWLEILAQTIGDARVAVG